MSGSSVTEVTIEEIEEWNRMTALNKQVAGNHYKDLPIQPVEYIYANALGYFEGNVVKYISRAGKKGSKLEDLKKAQWYLNREINKL